MATLKLLAEWFWTDRWTGSTAFLLPLEARGLYREMLTQAWRRGAQLPNDPEAIRRATGTTEAEWQRCWPLISRYWQVENGSLVNATQLEVYAETKAMQDRASERGRKGAQARAQALAQAQRKHVLKSKPPSPISSTGSVKNTDPVRRPAKQPPDGRIKVFLDWFQVEYKNRRAGADYLVRWEKDGVLVKQMLGATTLPRLKILAQIMLSEKCADEFIQVSDRGVGVLSARFNWLSDRLAEWERKNGTTTSS